MGVCVNVHSMHRVYKQNKLANSSCVEKTESNDSKTEAHKTRKHSVKLAVFVPFSLSRRLFDLSDDSE